MLARLKRTVGRVIAVTAEYLPYGDRAIILFINKNIKDYGNVLDLKFDKSNKTIELKVDLKGEDKALCVKITDFELDCNPASPSISIKSISADRALGVRAASQGDLGQNFS